MDILAASNDEVFYPASDGDVAIRTYGGFITCLFGYCYVSISREDSEETLSFLVL